MRRTNVSSVRPGSILSGSLSMDRDQSVEYGPACGGQSSRLGVDRVALTRRMALLLPQNLPVETWRRIGEQIFLISDSSSWWLGDWLNYGEKKYPDRYRNAVEETSLNYQTLRNYAWVSRKFSVSRRRDTLSFQHHLTVAPLSENEQDLWLDRAEQSRWSVRELRRQLRAGGEDCRGDEAAHRTRLELSVDPARSNRWLEAAGMAECNLMEWMVIVLDEAAGSILDSAARDACEV